MLLKCWLITAMRPIALAVFTAVNTANAIGRMAVISQHFNNTAILQQDGTVTARAPVNHHAV